MTWACWLHVSSALLSSSREGAASHKVAQPSYPSSACLFPSSAVYDSSFLLRLFLSLLWTFSFSLVCISLASTLLGRRRVDAQGLALFSWIWREKSVPDVVTTSLVMPVVDALPEWSKGVDSSFTSANSAGSNPTGVIWLWPQSCNRQLLAHRDALLEQGLELWGLLRWGKDPQRPSILVTAYWFRHRADSAPFGQSLLDFESNSLAAWTRCLLPCVSNKPGYRTCITTYRCHIALTPVAAGKRFFLACSGKPWPMALNPPQGGRQLIH